MPKFYTQYNRPCSPCSESGSPEAPVYGEVINDDGEIEIAQTGTKPLFELIQAAKPADLYEVLKASGIDDPLKLKDQIGFDEQMIVDFTSAPRSLAEAQMLLIKGQRAYDDLPLVVRDEFGSPAKLMTSLQDGSFRDRVSKFLPKNDVKVSEVVNESEK